MPRSTETLPRRRRSGFSIVLSLVVVSMLLLTAFTVASFVTIESRLVTQSQHHLRAKLNATVSLRLALAHLQQEAGPDRRITARADIIADSSQPGWNWSTIRNPLWTGVWRSDLQLQPPSWLISGRPDMTPGAQSANLYGLGDFYPDQWVPWQKDYTPFVAQLVPLVGDASAGPAELATATTPGKPDGRISLPKIALPDDNTNGSYCYWIGDEGVKARINLGDPRLSPPPGVVATPQLKQEALRGVVRSGAEILPGFGGLPLSGIDRRVTHHNQLSFLTNPTLGLVETNPPTRVRRIFPDATLWSSGVNADSLWGGLKVDLSLAFEMTDAEWKLSEFGEGPAPKDSAGGQLRGVTFTYHPNGVSARSAFSDAKMNVKHDGLSRNITPLYSFNAGGGLARGPTWEALRNYYRLYKEIDWTRPLEPELKARAHFPNAVSLTLSGYGDRNHYGRFYNREDSTGDFLNTTTIGGFSPPKATKVAVTPYVCRQVMVWGLQDAEGELRLTANPVTVLHNPYNVSLRLAQNTAAPEASSMRLSFRRWDSLTLQFRTATQTWTKSVEELAKAEDPTVNAVESFRCYLPADIVLKPGEFRIFSMPAAGAAPDNDGPRPFTRASLVGPGSPTPLICVPGLDTRGGVWMRCTDPANRPVPVAYDDANQNVIVTMDNTGAFESRVLMYSWSGDKVTSPFNGSMRDAFGACSELNTLCAGDMTRSGGPATLEIGGTGLVLPDARSQPRILAVHDYGIRWPKDPLAYPVFTHSNPMASVTRADANGMPHASTPGGFATTSPSYRMTIRQPFSWNDIIQTNGQKAYGGLSVNPALGGLTEAVFTGIPFAPSLSLAQLTHANYGLRDQEPLFQIGNSFAPLDCFSNQTYATFAPCGVTTHDHATMANSALFDRFFFSGAAPVINRAKTVTEAKPLALVLDEFAAGRGLLANPRTRLYASRDPAVIRSMLANPRRIAGTILSEGTFNVNSTSVEAWTVFLAGAKRNAMGSAAEYQPGIDKNARFPRAIRADSVGHNYRSAFNDPKAWTGLCTLDDAQIRTLAKSIVDEIRMRIRYTHRYQYGIKNGVDVHKVIKNRNTEIPLPFVGLSQFVNRFNCGAYPNQVTWQGCLQNAILRADTDGANLSNRSSPIAPAPAFSSTTLAKVTGDPKTNPSAAGLAPYMMQPGNIVATDPRNSANKTHALRGSPASLLQSDILEAVGSSLSTRSDTFVIRCYGEASDPLNPVASLAGCWIEAIVQRVPEFCDASQPPETEVSSPSDGQLHNPLLSQMNRTLGRRFVVLTSRTLKREDL